MLLYGISVRASVSIVWGQIGVIGTVNKLLNVLSFQTSMLIFIPLSTEVSVWYKMSKCLTYPNECTLKRSLLEQYYCSVNMDSKWYAGHKNSTKQKQETPQCEIGTYHMGHNLIFFKVLTILMIANPTLPFLQCGIKQHTLEVYLGAQKYCSEAHHIYIIQVVSLATEKLHSKAHFLSMLCESKGCSFTAGLFRPSSSSYNFENAGFRFCM